jgi:hypothetical protein
VAVGGPGRQRVARRVDRGIDARLFERLDEQGPHLADGLV